MEEKNSFERLVSGLTSAERQDMLEKMQASITETESLVTEEKIQYDERISFSEQIKQESIFYRIYLWIRSILANTSMEEIYNERKIANIARTVEKQTLNIVDYKRGLLLSGFYDKLNELHLCAEFFKPYIGQIESDESSFLVFLGSIIMDDIEKRMDLEVDPYSIPLTDGPRPEQRIGLLKKMDEIFTQIPSDKKAEMYNAVRAIEWLKSFSKLPYQRLLSCFSTVVEGNYSCSFVSLGNEISTFSRVLCNGLRIPKEVLEAIYIFSRRNIANRSLDSMEQTSEKAAGFMEKAKAQISMMHMFITTVPLRSIGCIVYSNAQWLPENLTGGEDWFNKYKADWKKLFDQKWEAWSHDCKKEVIRQSLERDFGLAEFPLLPDRPWTKLWGGLAFRYELTAGFFNWYFREQFPQYEMTLKTVMLEGDFVKKENRQEFFDSFNKLIQISIDLQNLCRNLSSGGEWGVIFSKLMDEHLRTLQAQSKIETILRSIESDVRSMLSQFGDAYRILELCFTGIFHEKTDSRYDGLSNMNRISIKNNEKFQENLKKARKSLENVYIFIRELEPVDTPSLIK